MQVFQRCYVVFGLLALGIVTLVFSHEWIVRSNLLRKLNNIRQAGLSQAEEAIPFQEIYERNDLELGLVDTTTGATRFNDVPGPVVRSSEETTNGVPQVEPTQGLEIEEKNVVVTPVEDKQVEDVNDEHEKERKLCSKIRSWASCIKHSYCAWKKIPNKEYCEFDKPFELPEMTLEEYDSQYDYTYDPNDNKRYFVYQTSGGFNNQRLLLEQALIVCQLLDRICIAPPAAPHTNYFEKYNIQPGDKLTSMQRVLNFESINSLVGAKAIPQGMSFMDWISERRREKDGRWKVISRNYKQYKPGEMPKWTEFIVKKKFKPFKHKFLYFENNTMWGAFDWKGSMAGWRQKLFVHKHLMYNNVLKRVARQLSEKLGENGAHNAIHVRRGDKTTESNFKRVSHGPHWYLERMLQFKEQVPALYIATDEKNRTFFQSFKDAGFQVYFWEDLDQDILIPFLKRYPARMFMDILGALEQLICTYAIKFLGSGYSTFTTFILRMRKRRKVIGFDTQLGDVEGLPFHARTTQSTCNPLFALTHSTPC